MDISRELFENLRRQNQDAFNEVYNYYKDKIYSYLYYKTGGDKNIVDDLFSDTFYSFYISLPKLRNAKNLPSLLILIAQRRFNDYLRKKYRERKYLSDIETKGLSEQNVFDNQNKNDEIGIEEKKIVFDLAIENLSDKYKKIIKMKYIEERTQKEIASHFNKKEKAIEGLLFRARESLKKEVKKLLSEKDIV